MPLSQAELASLIGCTREAVEQKLREWRQRGLIATGNRSIRVLRVRELARTARVAMPDFESAQGGHGRSFPHPGAA
ncbi:helix-turn-helix domain-containing protein [Actinomadura rudentiformis]|uniref:helix-turn-helix domain-containing protein n=1 Tax=Actinomadura rudentiformis TaxID=359158 RepID=UPI00178C58AD